MDSIQLALFASRLTAVCDEMGAQLRRAAFSPNIRDRLDFSCAVFDAYGALCAQAAHIPVHLGSMAYAMRDVVSRFDWIPGDVVVFNDPYMGGTHLPDVTAVAPLYVNGMCEGYIANRAHHADIGADSPGSMPISRHLDEEGLRISPRLLVRRGKRDEGAWREILGCVGDRREAEGDFNAQIASVKWGLKRAAALIESQGAKRYRQGLAELNDYAERLAREALTAVPAGRYEYEDLMDDDGLGEIDIPIRVQVESDGAGALAVSFDGTHGQVRGNINCPLSVTAAAAFYVFRCLMPDQTPACAGSLRPIGLNAPEGCLVNARFPAAVAAGNVETSQRIVDALLGALSQALPMPAASCGSMNNLAMGTRESEPWSYYETIAGGMGAGPEWPGQSAVQTHMTNTLNTPIEVLEMRYPLRIKQYAIRRGSGGAGKLKGGDGVIREFEFLAAAQCTVLSERRRRGPWGTLGGNSAAVGENLLNDQPIPGKAQLKVHAGDVLRISTPGGGGCGKPDTDF